jgi:hypothetical protein
VLGQLPVPLLTVGWAVQGSRPVTVLAAGGLVQTVLLTAALSWAHVWREKTATGLLAASMTVTWPLAFSVALAAAYGSSAWWAVAGGAEVAGLALVAGVCAVRTGRTLPDWAALRYGARPPPRGRHWQQPGFRCSPVARPLVPRGVRPARRRSPRPAPAGAAAA